MLELYLAIARLQRSCQSIGLQRLRRFANRPRPTHLPPTTVGMTYIFESSRCSRNVEATDVAWFAKPPNDVAARQKVRAGH
ncbi:MAG: hypothetical protein CMJ50_10730 [Planctomycetaceae bacterium]|nr:hypothetical protein [Planctomycetaceae bacterium]